MTAKQPSVLNDLSGNVLAAALRAPSLGREDAAFAVDVQGHVLRTYGVLWENVARTASALQAAGLQPGDRVAVQAPKTLEMLELYLATVVAGGVFLPLNTAYTAHEVDYFLQDAAPHVLVAADTAAQAGKVPVQWTLDKAGSGSLIAARDAAPAFAGPVPRSAEDLTAILYTSGTTGRSKGAMLSHRALLSNAETLTRAWGFTPQDVLVHALPIFHTHGLFVASNVILLAGASMVFMPRFDAAQVVAALPRATTLMGVPTFYTRLLGEPGLEEASRNVRLFISGSAPLLADTHHAWQQATGHAILERYGMTETNMNTSNPLHGARKAGTVGLPLPGVDVRVTDAATGQPLPQGDVGMIEVRGPNLFSGYWRMPDKTAEDMRADGFFITGDLGQFDEDGYLSIVGRAKDLIISGGFNIYPKEIELVIDAVPGVGESAVVGVPHADFGEAVLAFVTPQPGLGINSIDVPMIRQAVEAQLARFKRPRDIIVLDALPRNAMGKVQKAELRKRFGSSAA